jgi:histidyl-tRNA synthetase
VPYERPRGTKDYLPSECEERRAVLERVRSVFESYGYGEVMTPAFEHLELLVAKAGEEVVDQIYAFTDKAGRKLGLRFELTTPIARIVAENLSLPKPIRFYYIQPVWRYEEPQRGRLREFWQAGVELIGVPGAPGDAEVLAVLINSLRRAGLSSFKVHVNDRRLVEALLHWLGVQPELVSSALRAIDKLEKKGAEYVESELASMVSDKSRLRRFIELLGSDPLQAQLPSELPAVAREAVDTLEQLLQELEDGYGLAGFAKLDLSVVRGLDYYTSLVYEAKTPLGGELGSVAGGGRYDDLIQLVGGPQMPATGMAIGVERLMEALRVEGALAQRSGRSGYYMIPVAPQFRRYAIRVAERLRAKGEKVVVEITGRKLASALEAADRLGYKYAVVIGQREVESGALTIRDLEAWKEEKVPLELLSGS